MFHPSRPLRRLLLIMSLALAGLSTAGLAQQPTITKRGTITVSQPWSRATPGSAPVAGGYLTVSNAGQEADRLIGGSTDIATRLEIHDMAITNGIMTMRPLQGGLTVPPGGSVELKPAGHHIMFTGLKRGLKEGDRFKATLQFEKAGSIEIEFVVGSIGGTSPPAASHPHGH